MSRSAFPRRPRGFSLIEVMVAVVLVSIGLLGMALLQSTALRAGQSSSERTAATLLGYQALDMIRANRSQAALYGAIVATDFTAAGTGRVGVCAPMAPPVTPQWESDRNAWVCAARRALPEALGGITITGAAAAVPPAGPGLPATPATPGQVTITISWLDNRVTGARETFNVVSGL